ncbi:MAG: DUF432 domain-containing protein [Thermoplasmata archaeon]|nr:DUF432 domain-containing protein [Thermoplasmata archaeon]
MRDIFTRHAIPTDIVIGEVRITVEKEDKGYLYRRVRGEEVVEKRFFPSKTEEIQILPVEPVNLPGSLPDQLYISLEKPLLLPPGGSADVYLKFPVEIGVFLKGVKKKMELLDIFTLAKEKITFYGDFEKGHISRYYESDVYGKMPKVDPTVEGVLKLHARNKNENWVDIEKVVIPGVDMKIYYSQRLVSMVAKMSILKQSLARVEIKDTPLKKGMKKSYELHRKGALRMMTETIVVEVE